MQLVHPSSRHRDDFLAAIEEFQAEGLPWWRGPAVELAATDFDVFVRLRLDEATHATDARPPKTHLWAIVDGTFVGRLSIFHRL